MSFLNTSLETATSSLFANIVFNYNRENLSDFNNKVDINATVEQADISLIDLQKFYEEIGSKGAIHFTTNLSGQLNNLDLKELKLTSDKKGVIDGDINLKNSFNTENGFSLEADFNNLTSSYENLKMLLPNLLGKTLPIEFKDFGNFKLKGKTFVTENLVDVQISLDTDIGSTISDLELSNISNIDEASYKGYIEIIDFELAGFVKDSLMGQISVEAEIEGKGFIFDNLDTSVKGVVSKFEYNDYTFNNISLNGVVKNKHFNGELEVNDDDIKLNFNGLADLSSDVYKFDFKTNIDYFNLNKLNLIKRDSISILKGDIEINFRGNSPDNLTGAINFRNSLYTNQKDNYFFKDFAVTSTFEDSIRTITINSSEIIEGKILGNFKFKELGKLVQNSVGSIYTHYEPFNVTPFQKLDFRFEIYNKIVEVFYPEITLSANTLIQGKIDSDKNLFKLNVKSPRIVAYSSVIDTFNLQIDNKNPLFNTQLIIDRIRSDVYNVSDLHLVNKTLNDTLYFGTEFKGGKSNSERYNLSFYHTFNEENKSVIGNQKSSILFKDNEWLVNPEDNNKNQLVIDGETKNYWFNSFLITSNKQSITFSGAINDTISKDLVFDFKNVNLADITPEIDSLNLEGLINGELNYIQLENQIKPTANITVSDFRINDSEQGNLNVNIEGKNSLKNYAIDISMNRPNSTSFSAVGNVNLTSKSPLLDVIIDFNKFKLDAFSPLGEDVFDKIRGYAYGTVQLKGFLDNPVMEGELFLDGAGMNFPYLNVNYDFVGTSVI